MSEKTEEIKIRRIRVAGIMNEVIDLADKSDTKQYIDVESYVDRIESLYEQNTIGSLVRWLARS